MAFITHGRSLSVDMLVLVPAQIYVRRIIRHKLVLKSNLQIKTQIPIGVPCDWGPGSSLFRTRKGLVNGLMRILI